MKKALLFVLLVFLTSNVSFAEVFDNLTNLSPAQKDELTRTYQKYKTEYNSYETRIMEYTDKLNKLKSDSEKTPEQMAVLTGAYERNLTTLKAQQKKLEEETDAAYQSILTVDQYKEYKEQQVNTENAFNNFLKK